MRTSGKGTFRPHQVAKPGAMHQRQGRIASVSEKGMMLQIEAIRIHRCNDVVHPWWERGVQDQSQTVPVELLSI